MRFFKDIALGLKSYGKAISFMQKHHLRRFFLIPILLNLCFFFLGFSIWSSWATEIMNILESWIKIDKWEFWGSGAISTLIEWLISIILYLFYLFIYAIVGGYLILILLSPLFAYLSEKTEELERGVQYPFSFSQFVKDILRGIGTAIVNFMIEMMALVLLFFVGFIPVIGVVSTPLLFLISSFFYGYSILDYNLERRKLSRRASFLFMKRNKGLAIANGLPFALATFIPVIGISVTGILGILAAVAGSLSMLEKDIN